MGGKNGLQNKATDFPYSSENIIKPNTVIEAKIVLLGDSGVGKSSIAQRYCRNQFSENYDVTIGGAYLQQNITIDGIILKLHLWDTGGSDRFRSLVSMYYRDAVAAIICYDITNEHSF
jgi:small GTP-binding protein